MRYSEIAEALHSYDDPSWRTEFQPVKLGDTFRVFHGFRDLPHAIRAARDGLSGREQAERVYSYEYDNNPNGLFVTLSFKVAAEFVSGYDDQCVMEFVTSLDELEPPVWPGGSYTVQGQMAQYFGHGAKGRAARRQRARDAEHEVMQQVGTNPELEHIRQSDRKYLAYLLTNSREHQALFVGDLAPERIAAFHVRAKGSRYDAPFERLTREQFLQRYAERKVEKKQSRVYGPHENFDGDGFITRLQTQLYGGRIGEHIDLERTIANLTHNMLSSQHPTREFLSYFGNFLWPRQYKAAFLWMKRKYGKGGDEGTPPPPAA